MYYIVKLGSGYYATEILNTADKASKIDQHVQGGDIVILADDLEYAADQLGIDVEQIVIES